jgi:hypothetical protein
MASGTLGTLGTIETLGVFMAFLIKEFKEFKEFKVKTACKEGSTVFVIACSPFPSIDKV